MSSHAMELLDLALADPVTPISTKAFTVFTIHNDKLLTEIVDHIDDYVTRIFESGNSILLNRFGLITQAICLQSPENIVSKCPYILTFVRFCNNRSIYDMFDCFMTSNSILRRHLQSIGLVNEMLKALAEAVPGDGDMVTGIFKLIPLVRSQPEFADELTSSDAIRVMTREFPGASTLLLAKQWIAVSNCITSANAYVLIDQFQQLLALLQEETSDFYAHQEAIIKIFSALASHVPTFEDLLLQSNICEIFVSIVKSCPSHAIAHNAVENFFAENIKSKHLAIEFLHAMSPIITEGLGPSGTTIYRAFAWNILKKVEESGLYGDYVTERFTSNEDLMQKYTELSSVVSTEYGGEIETAEEETFTPDQFLALIRMLASKR